MMQFLEPYLEALPPLQQILQFLSQYFVEIICIAASIELLLMFLIAVYNFLYLRKVDKWFRNDILKDCTKPSSTLGRAFQVDHLLQTFRGEYVKKLADKTPTQLQEEYYKLTNEKAHTVYAYNRTVRVFFNLFYDGIPMFPLLGILGTVIAIACQFSMASDTVNEVDMILQSVTQNFGVAIWTTIFGIGFGIFYTIANAMIIESPTQKCYEIEKSAQSALDNVLHLIALKQSQNSSVKE